MQRLALDLHTHLKAAKRMPFRRQDAVRLAASIQARGLDGLAVTEHFHAINFWAMYDALASTCVGARARFYLDDVVFYTGAELTLEERMDVAIIAPLSELRRLDDAFYPRLSEGHHPSAASFIEARDALNLDAVCIAAHPGRPDKGVGNVDSAILPRLVDAVEWNPRFDLTGADARRIGQLFGLPVVAGSDAHVWLQAGAAWTELAVAGDSFEDLKDAILAGRVRTFAHPGAKSMCDAGAAMKSALKATHFGAHEEPEVIVEPSAAERFRRADLVTL